MIEVLKQALDALDDKVINEYKVVKAITAIKEALAQTKQKPVAWMYVNTDGECEQIEYGEPFDDPSTTPLYTHPPQLERNFCSRCGKRTNDIHTCTPPQRTWVGLTDGEITKIVNANSSKGLYLMAKAIEAKLKEKNT